MENKAVIAKERPILFNAPMVLALLDGSKTQTRRVMKNPPTPSEHFPWLGVKSLRGPGHFVYPNALPQILAECPYGQTGDRLWVRETWGVISHAWNEYGEMVDWTPDRPATSIHELPFGHCYYSGHVIYAADGPNEWACDDDGGGESRSAWHPSIHMPRAASRILLEIVNVRVERLQDISEEDAAAEGAPVHFKSSRDNFCALWQQINGDGSWDANPWVWVVEFKYLRGE